MRYAKLLTVILICGMLGCSNSEVKEEESSNDEQAKTTVPTIDVPVSTASNDPVSKTDDDTKGASKMKRAFVFSNKHFDAPVMLMAGDEPMKAGYSYPSPTMFDVDNDGDIEMVLGEIMGTVSVCENENKSGGEPVWGPVNPLLNAEGKPLKLNNW